MKSDALLSHQIQQILWVLPDPLMALDGALQVKYMNSSLEGMLDVTLSQIEGKPIHELELKAGSEWGILIDRIKGFEGGGLGAAKKAYPSKNNGKKSLVDPLTPQDSFGPYQDRPQISLNEKIYFYELFNAGDPRKQNAPLLIVLFREITKDIEINDQMVQAEKMSGLGTLAAGLAHELNNPLYSIIGFSEMILKEEDKDMINSIASRIREKSKNLVGILENLNSYIQANPLDGHMTVNINERLDAALGIALLTYEAKSITINKCYSPLPFLKAKADEIQQIFFNIISNSIQAMGERGELEIRSASENEGIVVTIKDTGEGVPREYIAKVFDPFFTTKDQGEGTGLGLTAAYQLVKKYGGRIKFDSIQGEGTTVEIFWPVGN